MSSGPGYPWASFSAFQEVIEALERDLPLSLKSSSPQLSKFSTNYSFQLLSTLRFFDFLTDKNQPTNTLGEYLKEKDKRPKIMEKLLRGKYPFVFSNITPFDEITDDHIEKTFNDIIGSDRNKSRIINFFKNAAIFAGIPISAKINAPSMQSTSKAIAPTVITTNLLQKEENCDVFKNVPPNLQNLIKDLASKGIKWSKEDRKKWLIAFESNMDYYYEE